MSIVEEAVALADSKGWYIYCTEGGGWCAADKKSITRVFGKENFERIERESRSIPEDVARGFLSSFKQPSVGEEYSGTSA